VTLTRDQWVGIGLAADWLDAGFGVGRFRFFSGPGVYCVCPKCGHMKGSVRLFPCERQLCPRCGGAKMEKKYVRGGEQMSPRQY